MRAFLSSTYADLLEYRRAAADAIQRLGHDVIAMEVFGARPEEPRAACLREVEASDLVVGIYAHRYGFVPAGADVSITEQEYDHARKKDKPVFPFFVSEDEPWPPKHIEGEPGSTKLKKFKERVGNERIRDVFSTPNDLAFKVAAAVGRYVAKERVGGLATQLKSSLGVAELTTRTLTEGRTLSDASEDTRNKVKRLLGELFSTMNEFPEPVKHDPVADPETILAVAEGLMAQGKWLDAGRKLEEYAAEKPDDWEACNLRGVAFANSRAGQTTDLAALRACNDAIAFIPASIEVNMRARLFAYRGAILKRLRRLEEAEADLMIAKRHATREYEVEDVIYNLAGVFALQGERQKMLAEIAKLSTKPDVLAAIRGHLDDYFHAFSQDPEFLNMIGAWEK